jgi:integrase
MPNRLSRRLKRGKSGRLVEAGAYLIAKQIPNVPDFAGIPKRIARTSGVFPGTRDAEKTVAGMKLMLKDLIQQRDADALRRIQKGQLTLPSAYKKWLQGRLHLSVDHEAKPLLKMWNKYLDESGLAMVTRENRRAIVASLVAKGLIADKHVVNDMPELLHAIRKRYAADKHANAFNAIRIEITAFVTKGLRMDKGDPFVLALKRVPQLPVPKRRPHHPFYTPRDCAEFCRALALRPTPNAPLYAQSVLFMCRHGLRPTEFGSRRFDIDKETGHLRIGGTKNPNARRLVPLSFAFSEAHPPRIDNLNETFERMGSVVRCRDFRRTFSIWCEAAGVPKSRIEAYMGHEPQSVTQTYQATRPRQDILDEDRDRLKKWYDAELAKAPVVRKKGPDSSAFRELMRVRQPSLAVTRSRLAAERKADAKHKARHPWDD